MFRFYDDNGDKGLDLEEFTEGIRDYRLDYSMQEIRALFAAFDTDGSGKISFDEFLVKLRVSMMYKNEGQNFK